MDKGFLNKRRENLLNKILNGPGTQLHSLIFFGILFAGIVLTVLMLFLDFSRIDCILWSGLSGGVFPDFFQSLMYKQDPYSLYPEGVYLFLDFMLLFIPDRFETYDFMAVSLTPHGLCVSILFFSAASVLLFGLIFKFSRGTLSHKIALCLTLAASAPFVYLIERGNLIIISVLGSAIFLFLNRSSKRYLRVISYFSLAVGAAFKIYPAILGLILVYEKRFKAALACLAIGIAIFVLPYFFKGGLNSFFDMLENINYYQQQSWVFGTAYKTDLTNFCNIIGNLTGAPLSASEKVGEIMRYAFGITAVVAAAFADAYWKKAGLLMSVIVLCMPFSWIYTLCYYIPVVILFFNEQKEPPVGKIVYSMLFALMFVLVPFGKPGFIDALTYESISTNLATLIENFTAVVLGFLLLAEAISAGFFKVKNLFNRKKI